MKQDLKARVDEAEDTGEMRRTQEMDRWMHQVESLQQNCKSSYKLGKRVSKILNNVDELATKGQRFSMVGEVAHKLPTRLAIDMPPDETVGLDLMFTKVWDSIEAENVGVIGLYGMGGVGKTTLLKKINNELGKRMLDFNLVMWIVVSKEPNLDSIMENIRKQIGIEDNIWNRCSNHDEKVGKIYYSLKQQKFVLLLDDIWESLELKMVGVPHPKDNNFQSKVLFTTQSKDVCAKMQAQSTFQVEILTEKESLELFFMKVGEETLKSHPDIPKLAQEMAAECKGLPLALIVVGSAMAGVKSVEAWEYSRNNLTSSSWTSPNLETKVFSILKISFDKLSDEAHRNCFLYCALYPEDYEIGVRDLIDKWIGEGFLSQDTGKSMRDMCLHGESVIQNLKLSCLLESVEDDLFLCRKVKMHDVIRDMALWIVRGQDKPKRKILVQEDASRVSPNDIEMWKTVERISIIDYDELHLPAVACPNLTTITFAMNELGGPKTLDWSNIQYMTRLKVFDVSSSHPQKIIKLPAKFGDLVHLEYLSLMGDMSMIPTELKKLRNLKHIALYNRSDDVVGILLEVVSNLEELRVLRFINTSAKKNKEERKLLEQLEFLPKLEELSIEITSKDGLEKLNDSTKLQSCVNALVIGHHEMEFTNMALILASMSKMKQLEETFFNRLFCVDGDNLFSSLVELHLIWLSQLEIIHKAALSFPSLRLLRVSHCSNLKKLPLDYNSSMDKLRHIEGDQRWWDNLEWEDPEIKNKLQAKFKGV
ncbi:putative disease resistance protein [Senna tora]|uniref:Putative disease resistance protein n=1 Tax=Senna tora TaxID=362788 RepID=A0A834X1G5_9FABA|nr:putative disease resistance protein [Senna tora]